jgi:hypothetical protein
VKTVITGLAGIALAFATLSTAAIARVEAQGSDLQGRHGGNFGASIGFGRLGCDDNGNDCSGSGANQAGYLAVHGGVMVSSNVAIMGDLWGMAHTEERFTVSQILLTAAVRVWPVQRFWLEGGLGIARAGIEYDAGVYQYMSRSDVVPAAMLGLGVEVISRRNFALDVELRAGTGFYNDDVSVWIVSLGVGVNWY